MSVDEEYLQGLMRTISHDMGGTLRVAVGFSKLLLDNYSDQLDEKAINWLSMIKSDGERTQEKLIALSRYARLYDIPDAKVPCDLNQLCEQAIKISALDRYPDFTVTAEALPSMMGYERLWVDLLSELIVNSARYSGGAPSINCRIYSEHEEGEVTINVHDNGVGLTAKQIEQAVMPFRGVDSEFPEGVGMGFSIVKRIAELQGGRMQLLSNGNGIEGLAIMIIFPESVLLPES
ncbi:MAG: sensor histidine kinase [Cellvibrionaceae bacterium]